jgi:histidinol-phosphate aminotransferase
METSVVDRRKLLSLALAAAALPASGPALARKAQRTPMSLRYPIRLSANENPWGPGPQARAAIVAATDEGCRYGMDYYGRLVEAIAAKEKVEKDRIVIGSGSGELLHMLALAYCDRGQVVCAWPTFGQLMGFAEKVGSETRKIPVDAELRHDLPALAAATTPNTSLLYVCNPNNPTGTVIDGPKLRAFCGEMAQRTLVVVDEAYLDLVDEGATESMVDLARGGANLIVLRTFSKIHGLAGLRVGYGIAPPGVIQRLRRYQMASPNVLGIAAATASLGDADFLARTRASLISDRRRVTAACDELGLRYAPPQGNFVFFRPGMPIAAFGAKMKEKQIEVGRPFEPLLDWCRVTVGTTEETGVFIDALRAVVKA